MYAEVVLLVASAALTATGLVLIGTGLWRLRTVRIPVQRRVRTVRPPAPPWEEVFTLEELHRLAALKHRLARQRVEG